jgi:hypothetical protein
MKTNGLVLLFSLALCSCAAAGKLNNTFTMPGFEASSTGDTCAASAISLVGTMTARRTWTGPVSGQDSVTGRSPGTAVVMTTSVPNGTYTVTVDVRDSSGLWSCPASVISVVRGNRPARASSLGWITPPFIADMLAVLLEPNPELRYR